jgi:hypothetical protein
VLDGIQLLNIEITQRYGQYKYKGTFSGVCQFEARDPSHFKNAGVGNSTLHYSHGSILLEYADGDPCDDGTKRSTRIVFVCARKGSERVVFIDEQDGCKYLINWYTVLACSTQV